MRSPSGCRRAARAGHHHNAVLDTALSLGATGLNLALGAGGKSRAARRRGRFRRRAGGRRRRRGGTSKWVDADDGRAEEVSVALERAEPYLLARAMAGDERWRPLMVDPEDLAGLDVVRSARHRATFDRWLRRQPVDVATPVTALIEALAPDASP